MNGRVSAMHDVRGIYEAVECLGRTIVASVTLFPKGVHISIYGGDKPHIGAVTNIGPDGEEETTLFPTHRDDVVSRRWGKRLKDEGLLPAVVEVGIHYDGLTKEGVEAVIRATDRLLEGMLGKMQHR